jgi:uncharacterized membrane protein YfhO
LRNTFAFGNAWFAENIVWVQTPNEEIDALEAVNLRETAVLHNEFREMLNDFDSQIDSSATIKLTQYAPNKLNYELRSVHNQLVVFSEIWTTKGWNLYVDGQKHDLLRANYILRAALIPAGNHQLEMRYEPRVWAVGEKVSLASSLLLILLAVGIFINFLVKQKKAEA